MDVGFGLRFGAFSVGPRINFSAFSAFTLWQADLEAAMHIRRKAVEWSFGVHGGYTVTGTISDSALVSAELAQGSDFEVHGLDVGLQATADYRVSSRFLIGCELGGQVYFLSRPAPTIDLSNVSLGGYPPGFFMESPLGGLLGARGASTGLGFEVVPHATLRF